MALWPLRHKRNPNYMFLVFPLLSYIPKYMGSRAETNYHFQARKEKTSHIHIDHEGYIKDNFYLEIKP